MKKRQSHSPCSPKSSHPSKSNKKNESSISSCKQTKMISEYFTKISSPKEIDTKDSSSSQSLDSPYKNSLSKIKCIHDESTNDDFQTPKPIKSVIKLNQKNTVKPNVQNKGKRTPKTKRNRTLKKLSRKTNPLLKTTEDNFTCLDVNPEHLQMAIALSKSTYAVENPGCEKLTDEKDLGYFSGREKTASINTTLERFGFKSDRPKLNPEMKRDFFEVAKKSKNSKFRFITPILYIRTTEERDSLIASKISLVLCQNRGILSKDSEEITQYETTVFSNILQKYNCKEKSIFKTNTYSLEEMDSFSYYSKSLEISPTESVCGCLLKNWEEIPGREKSPSPEDSHRQHFPSSYTLNCNISEQVMAINVGDNVNVLEENNKELEKDKHKSNVRGSNKARQPFRTSPDLFASEDETENEKCSGTFGKLGKEFSDCTFSKTDLGIDHFESFYSDPKNLSQKFYDLTESDDENGEFKSTPLKFQPVTVDLTQSSSDDDYSENKYEEVPKGLNKGFSQIKKLQDNNSNDQLFHNSQLCTADEDLENFEQDQKRTLSEEIYENSTVQIDAHEYNDTKTLNITDYVNKILNNDSMTINGQEISSVGTAGSTCANEDIPHIDVLIKKNYNYTENYSIKDSCTIYSKNDEDFEKSQQSTETNSSQRSCSQESIIVSDEELNYSSIYSNNQQKNKQFYDLSCINADTNINATVLDEGNVSKLHADLQGKYRRQENIPEEPDKNVDPLEDSFNNVLNDINIIKSIENEIMDPTSKEKDAIKTICTSKTLGTPENNIIIKTKNITPMANFDEMDTPKIVCELHKFGLKPLKRQRGVKLLKYIYESTHPLIGPEDVCDSSDEEDQRIVKRTKRSKNKTNYDNTPTDYKENRVENERDIFVIGDLLLKNEKIEDLVFERKQSGKTPSCQIPLQTAWHNFLSSNPQIHEKILLYEPLQLEEIHAMLRKQSGCKFHVQDLLTFLDKKCITIRTAHAQGGRTKKKNLKTHSADINI